MLLSPARGRGWERGLRELYKPPLLASPPSGGEEHELSRLRVRAMANDTGLTFLRDVPPSGGGPVFGFDNSYARLPERFYAQLDPTPVSGPRLIKVNEALARELGLDPEMLATPQAVEVLAGNRLAAGSQPIA